MKPFRDRIDAGRRLVAALPDLAGEDAVVLGIARGGVAVAAPIARALRAPLDVLIVRKLGAPGRPELAIGAVADVPGSTEPLVVLDRETIDALSVSPAYLREETQRQVAECRRREEAYRDGRPRVALEGRTALVVDDGLATGSTARVAVEAARRRGARRVVLCVPVASPGAADSLRAEVDGLVALETPRGFHAVGQYYERFEQTPDETVVRALRAATEVAGE